MDADLQSYPIVSRIVTVSSAAGGDTHTYVNDRDCNLIAAYPVVGGGCVVSFDPALTWASFATTPASGQTENLMGYLLFVVMKIPISSGTKIYLAFAGGAPAVHQLYFDA